MMKTLILGIGSPFGDDQFGLKTADYLKRQTHLLDNENLSIELADRPGLNLLYWLDQPFGRLILIDAVKADLSAGTPICLKGDVILSFDGFLSSHAIGIAPALALAQALGKPIEHVLFYGIVGRRLNVKDDVMSAEAEKAISVLGAQIQALISTDKSPKPSR
ncbi:MAG: hydrogenase maturation protease [Francisellaceae bacterium]